MSEDFIPDQTPDPETPLPTTNALGKEKAILKHLHPF